MNDFAKDMKDFKKSLPLAHGTALHEVCDLAGIEHELSMFCNIKEMKPFDPQKITLNELEDKHYRYQCVKGSMDDLVENKRKLAHERASEIYNKARGDV